MLPRICSSSEVYGTVTPRTAGRRSDRGHPGRSTGGAGGADLLRAGEAKNTYGTGCFLLMNTGEQLVRSKHGLLTTVAYKFGKAAGAVCAGRQHRDRRRAGAVAARQPRADRQAAPKWKSLARSVKDNGGVYFVPAFSGLYAPYWKDNARGVIAG